MVEPTPYTEGELINRKRLSEKRGKCLYKTAFPIGGIGTGTISITARGELVDLDIQNRPDVGSGNTLLSFTLWAKEPK